MMDVSKFFTEEQKKRITNAIKEAETNTSGELRVHIENTCPLDDVMDRAAFLFEKLKMHKTGLRNGVLFYISLDDHQFAILGDAGINKETPDDFWDHIKEKMLLHLQAGDVTGALVCGINEAGKALHSYFPYQQDDVNELSDEISFGR
jgi:uncharacterized membrane protein